MKRRARCWICGALFQAERGALPRGARFVCGACAGKGLSGSPERGAVEAVLRERHEVPFADLREIAVEEAVLRHVPEELALHHTLLPIALRERKGRAPQLVVAMADPGNDFVKATVSRRCGLEIIACVAPWAEIAEAIEELYLPLAISEEPVPE